MLVTTTNKMFFLRFSQNMVFVFVMMFHFVTGMASEIQLLIEHKTLRHNWSWLINWGNISVDSSETVRWDLRAVYGTLSD